MDDGTLDGGTPGCRRHRRATTASAAPPSPPLAVTMTPKKTTSMNDDNNSAVMNNSSSASALVDTITAAAATAATTATSTTSTPPSMPSSPRRHSLFTSSPVQSLSSHGMVAVLHSSLNYNNNDDDDQVGDQDEEVGVGVELFNHGDTDDTPGSDYWRLNSNKQQQQQQQRLEQSNQRKANNIRIAMVKNPHDSQNDGDGGDNHDKQHTHKQLHYNLQLNASSSDSISRDNHHRSEKEDDDYHRHHDGNNNNSNNMEDNHSNTSSSTTTATNSHGHSHHHFWEGPYFYCLCTNFFLQCIHTICTPHVHPPCCRNRNNNNHNNNNHNHYNDNNHNNNTNHHQSIRHSINQQLSHHNPIQRIIPPPKRRILCRTLIIIFMIITITFTLLDLLILHRYLNVWLASTLDWLSHNPVAGGIVFIGIFLMGSLCFFPVTLLALGAGYVYIDLYGLLLGIVIAFWVCYFGCLLGAAVCFVRSRYLMRQLIQKFSIRYPIVRAVDRAFGTMGFRLFLLLRLSPAMPFNALNYIGGITAIRFRDYWLATCVGIVPGLLWTIFVGATFGTVDQRGVDGNKEFDQSSVRKGVVLGLGIGLGVMGLIGTGIYARRELTKIVMAEQMEIMMEEQEGEAMMGGEGGSPGGGSDRLSVSMTSSRQSMIMEDLENPQLGEDSEVDYCPQENKDSFDNDMLWNYQSEASGLSLGHTLSGGDFRSPHAMRAFGGDSETGETSPPSSVSPTEYATKSTPTAVRHTPMKQRPRPWTPELVATELPILPSIFRRLNGVPALDMELDILHNTNHTAPVRMAFSEGMPGSDIPESSTSVRCHSPIQNRRRANTDTVAYTAGPSRVPAIPISLGGPFTEEMIGLANIDEQTVLSVSPRGHVNATTPATTGKIRGNRTRSNTDPTVLVENTTDKTRPSSASKATLSASWIPKNTLGLTKRHSVASLNDLKKSGENNNTEDSIRSLSSSERFSKDKGGEESIHSQKNADNEASTPDHLRARSRSITPTPPLQDADSSRHSSAQTRRHTVQLSPSGNHFEVNLASSSNESDNGQDREWFWIWA